MSIKMNKVNRNMNLWIVATSTLLVGFVLASNANGAIRKVCPQVLDNGTKIYSVDFCKRGSKWEL